MVGGRRTFVTTTGLALGTPSYMAPEQAMADKKVDHRADLYAVGVVGYEMLAGRRPFPGNTAQQIVVAQMTKAPEELLCIGRRYRRRSPPSSCVPSGAIQPIGGRVPRTWRPGSSPM